MLLAPFIFLVRFMKPIFIPTRVGFSYAVHNRLFPRSNDGSAHWHLEVLVQTLDESVQSSRG